VVRYPLREATYVILQKKAIYSHVKVVVNRLKRNSIFVNLKLQNLNSFVVVVVEVPLKKKRYAILSQLNNI